MPRTLDGLTVGDFDEITANDDLTVKGNATLSGMNLDGSLTATAISASGDVATTGDVSGTNLTASGTVSGATITASGNVSCANLTASGNITCDDITADDITADDISCATLTTTGNTSLGNSVDDLHTMTGAFSYNSTIVGNASGALIATGSITTPNINVGSGSLIATVEGTTFDGEAVFGGEVSMALGGSELFDMNDHGITKCGSIAMTTGGDIGNCDEITCETLHVNSGLNLDGVSLDLGAGSLTANGGLNTTGSSVIRGLSCRAIDTNDNHIVTGTGSLTANGGITTTGPTSCRAIDTNGHNLTMGNGDLTCDTIASKAINTTNSYLTMGYGNITCYDITGRHFTITGDFNGYAPSGVPSSEINGFTTAPKINDIPRIIDYRCITGEQHNHGLTTSWSHPHTDLSSLNCYIPPSCIILVEVDFQYYDFNTNGAQMYGRLCLAGTDDEVWEEKIDDEDLCYTTDLTIVVSQRGEDYPTKGRFHHEWILKFPTTERGNLINLEPQFKTSSGTATLVSGKNPTYNWNFGMMSMKITAMPRLGEGVVVPVGVHIHTEDDY